MWDNCKRHSTCVMRIQGEERETRAEEMFGEIMNFPNKDTKPQIKPSQKMPNRINKYNSNKTHYT